MKNLLKITQPMSVDLKVSPSLVHSMQPGLCQPELLFSVLQLRTLRPREGRCIVEVTQPSRDRIGI